VLVYQLASAARHFHSELSCCWRSSIQL